MNWGLYGSNNPGWGWTRKAITGFFEESLREKIIPFEHRKTVCDIIEILTNDLNPSKEDEKEQSFDPFTKAINSVRGSALECVFHYIYWVRDNDKNINRHSPYQI